MLITFGIGGAMLTSLSQLWRFWARVATQIGVSKECTLETVGIGPEDGAAP